MKREGIEIKWSNIGAELAHEGSDVQAEFFGAFAKELIRACKSHHGAEMQLCGVNDELDKDARELLHMIGFKDDGKCCQP